MVYNNACLVKRNALLAQLVEHLTLNQGVQGSSPWRRIGIADAFSLNFI